MYGKDMKNICEGFDTRVVLDNSSKSIPSSIFPQINLEQLRNPTPCPQ
jgi:hypothetical protein